MTELERLGFEEKLKIQLALREIGYSATIVRTILGDEKITIEAVRRGKKICDGAISRTRELLADA
jgi:hypothetical protein